MVIDTLQLDIIVNNKGTTARINSTTKALKDLHKVISDINGTGGVDGTINGGGGSGSSSSGGSSRSSGARGAKSLANNLKKSLNFGSMIAKLYFIRNITKQLGQNLAKVVQYGIDYEETLNLWQTAMRGNISQARVFTSEMTKAYGISSATLMNYQATFKNMLAALGNISENTAYGLSEALTQMALDFSSLYNVSVEEAMTKFQAVLSGQVRPIRTAGYDITEQTLFQLYQQLGGTKTVRQLNQTEKQLLRILAVYKQMERSGATGDLSKTITSSANQLRIMKEQIREFATWAGVGFNTMLEKSGILIEINAWLYAGVALAKQFAIEMGYVEKDYSIDMDFENIENANEEVDQLKEKLLGFDKFQVLQSAGKEDVGIEQTLLNSLKAYEGIINNTKNPAFERSLELLKGWGLELDENGNIVGGFDKVKEKITEIAQTLKGVIMLIGLFTKPWLVLAVYIEKAYLTDEQFRNSVNQLLSALSGALTNILPTFVKILESFLPVITGIINGFANVVTFLDRIGALEFVIWAIVTALIAWKTTQAAIGVIKFAQDVKNTLIPAITSAASFIKKEFIGALAALGVNLKSTMLRISSATLGIAAMGATIALAFSVFQNWDDMSGVQKLISVLGLLTTALLGAALAFGTFQSAKTMGLAVAGITAGIIAVTASINSAKSNIESMEVTPKAKGGLADKGSLFLAGEAGPELVTQTSGGGSTIMNMKQLEDAVARGFIRGFMSTDKGDTSDNSSDVYIDGQKVFNVMRGVARRNGYDFAKV